MVLKCTAADEQGGTMDTEYQKALAAIAEVKKTVTGKDACVKKAFAAILAGGHILIEDVPGVGKTTLALAISKAMELVNHRVQFTPDVMPADILGFNMYHKESGTFSYYPGAIMCNLFLADEINRTSPKTQSALLEVMEEGIVTVDGTGRKVPEPFIVMATQNPKGSAGTQLLPESQLDRFMICMSMGYPDLKSEVEIAKGRTNGIPLAQIRPVMRAQELVEVRERVEEVFVHNHIYAYIAKLMQETRDNPYLELGVSPRGTIACTKMAKAWAFLAGRDYVVPEDVEAVFLDVTKLRIVLSTKARVTHVTEEAVLTELFKTVRQPASYMERSDYRV
jgi:MoxR-like ATPase